MHLIRVGRRRINCAYLIMDEENDGTPETAHIPVDGVRVTMEAGKEFNLTGQDAETYRRAVDAILCNDPTAPKPKRSPTVGHAVRRAGAVEARVPVKRKGGG